MAKTAQEVNGSFTYQDFIATVDGFAENYSQDIDAQAYFSFPLSSLLNAESGLLSPKIKSIAYFSMEYGLAPSIYNTFIQKKKMSDENKFFSHEVFSNNWLCDYLFKVQIDKMLDIPIYGGGLGVLAGDVMKSSADLNYSMVGIGVLWNRGYFKQNFWYKHGQVPEELRWDPYSYPGLIPLKNRITINTKEGPLHLRLWKYCVYSFDKSHVCPLILLDSNVSENPPHFRKLTDQLYRSDDVWWRIFQRSILGIGGRKALHELGYSIDRYHLNEGHAAFAFLEEYLMLEDKNKVNEIKQKFVFTCHTPVAAGHDRFKIHDVAKILTPDYVAAAEQFGKEHTSSDEINLTSICLNNCERVNAVSMKHGEIMRVQFPQFAKKINSITNGVHTHTWISESFQQLLERYKETLGGPRDNFKNINNIEKLRKDENFRREIFDAHMINKRRFVDALKRWKLQEDVFTLGWARRIAGYKRPALIFHNLEAIIQLAKTIGPMQIILAGKAHPNDNIGASHIDEILDHIDQLNEYKNVIKVLILENYDTYFGKFLTNSVDVWLNNPLPPFEASGTSGMKAIMNGVLQLTTLDGWVVEAVNSDIGWIFGYEHKGDDIGSEKNLRLDEDAQALCEKLREVMQLYYQTFHQGELNTQSAWLDKMINCVKASVYFNTHRMMQEYKQKMWQI